MKDKIIEEIWQAKELIASHAHGDFKRLAEYIKQEAIKIKPKGQTINLKEKLAQQFHPADARYRSRR